MGSNFDVNLFSVAVTQLVSSLNLTLELMRCLNLFPIIDSAARVTYCWKVTNYGDGSKYHPLAFTGIRD